MLFFRMAEGISSVQGREKQNFYCAVKTISRVIIIISIETCVAGLPWTAYLYVYTLGYLPSHRLEKSTLYTIDLQPPSVYSPSGSLARTF
jgi:hypothetical protein